MEINEPMPLSVNTVGEIEALNAWLERLNAYRGKLSLEACTELVKLGPQADRALRQLTLELRLNCLGALARANFDMMVAYDGELERERKSEVF